MAFQQASTIVFNQKMGSEELERQSIQQSSTFFSFSTSSLLRYCSKKLPESSAEEILKPWRKGIGHFGDRKSRNARNV